jgi:plastocyanin
MRISSKSLFLLASILAGVFVGGSAGAAPTTTVMWKVSSLMAGEAKNLSAVVSTNSPGTKTWLKRGSCTLTPVAKPSKLTMGSTGSCVLTLKIAKSKGYPAKSSSKTISLMVLATTTTTATAPTRTITQSGFAFTPTNLSISVGQTVSFVVNASHDVTWRNGDPGRDATGAPYARTFSNAGTYSFYCSLHPEMTGTITVG